tara:strand:+ start:179 stop:574 length:396 start_codon:yes stop_codon:yes gene_type:complete
MNNNIFSKFTKLIFVLFGLVFLAIGIAGYILPGLPGTIFVIISAGLFMRSSPKLYAFVTQNSLFGRQLREYLETGVMPLRAKILSLSSIWVFTTISILWAPYGWIFDVVILILALAGSIYILSKPTRPKLD